MWIFFWRTWRVSKRRLIVWRFELFADKLKLEKNESWESCQGSDVITKRIHCKPMKERNLTEREFNSERKISIKHTQILNYVLNILCFFLTRSFCLFFRIFIGGRKRAHIAPNFPTIHSRTTCFPAHTRRAIFVIYDRLNFLETIVKCY